MGEITWRPGPDGWLRRYDDGRETYARCWACDCPTDRLKRGLCEECVVIADAPDDETP